MCSALGASPARFPSDGPSRQAGLPRHGAVSLAGRLVPDDPPGPCARERGVLHHEHAVDEYVRDPGGMHAGIVIAVFVDDGIRVKDHQIRVVALGDDALVPQPDLAGGERGHLADGLLKGKDALLTHIAAEDAGVSGDTVRRFIRLNNLVPDLQKKVDDGSLKFNPAVELSYLTSTEQNDFLDYIESQSCSPSLSQAQKLKAASKEGALDHGKLLEIMDTKKPSVPPRDPTLTIRVSKIARYFPTGYTQEQMVGIIMQLLERNSRHLMPEKQTSLER